MLSISFDVESREYNGRWYTDVKAWKVEPAGTAKPGAPIDQDASFTNDEENRDDLPF
jgi:hypothetical protein